MTALQGKVALVTGGSRGIGAAIVKRLSADGARVAFTYSVSKDQADAVLGDVTAAGGTAYAIRADGTKDADVIAAVHDTIAQCGRLDVLVNNAGVATYAPIDQLTSEQIDDMLAVNVRAVVLGTKAAVEKLADGGRIINIGSVNAERMPSPGGSVYSLSKAAVAGFTRGLTRDLAPRGITVNNVQPGPIDTDMNPADGPHADDQRAVIATGEYGTADDIAAFVAFLAGPEASYITGANLTIDGGYTA